MSFPQDPVDLAADLFVGGQWVDIAADVYNRDAVDITRGRANETSQVAPSTCTLTLNNRSGKYSPRNPLGPYFGQLGRNSPLRVAVRKARDTFTRTVVDGWGSTDAPSSLPYSVDGTAADVDVTGGKGTVNIPAATDIRITYLPTAAYTDVDWSTVVTLPVTNITGGPALPAGLLVRALSVSDFYYARVEIATDESVSVGIRHASGTTLAAQVVVAGLTHTSAQALSVRVLAEGETMRAKVWATASGEPYGWTVTATGVPRRAGFVGIRTALGAGSTNGPLLYSYDETQLRVPRFIGEVSSWPPRWDISGKDAHTPIDASGILRRLGQGNPALRSPLYRGVTSLGSSLRAYWPCEDLDGATQISSALGGPPMLLSGTPDFAGSTAFVCSAPLPVAKGSAWFGDVPGYSSTGEVQLRFLLRIPPAGETDDRIIARLGIAGSASLWEVVYLSGGGLRIKAYDVFGTQIMNMGPYGYALDGAVVRLSLELKNNGSDVDWLVSTLAVGDSSGGFTSGTLAGYQVGQCLQVQITPQGAFGDTVVGHVSLESTITSLFSLNAELAAYVGETAGRRIKRLCAEEDVPFSWRGDLDDTTLMGPQAIDTLVGLLTTCAEADLGTLYEPRADIGLGYRTRASLYNQAATATLDMAAAQVGHPVEPVDDDALTRNDVTARRTGGSSFRATLESGAMSVSPPQSGGIGRYDTSVEVGVAQDTQLPDVAGWLMHLGTVDEARYPQILANLAASAVAGSATLVAALLAMDIDDRLLIISALAVNAYADISQLGRGYTESIELYGHTLAFNCSPESPYQVLILDDAASRWDTAGSTLAVGVSSSATSLSVATATGPLWTTAAGQFPLQITIGGEVMTVTTITGAASPQTFTVTRSTTVVKGHLAGADVRLARRPTLAL